MIKKRVIPLLLMLSVSVCNSNNFNADIKGSQNFAKAFYKEIIKDEKYNASFVYSPFSIQIAGALLYTGADGDTAEEILNGFNFKSKDPEKLGEYFYNTIKNVNFDEDSLLKIANKVYISNNYTLSSNYKDIIVKKYDSDIEKVNFETTDETTNKINNWVKEKTGGKIENLITSDTLASDTILLLLNAIHFKGFWNELFNKNFTRKLDFYTEPDRIIEIDTMQLLGHFNVTFKNDIGLKAIDIPFKNSDLSLFLVSSAYKNESLNVVENKLNSINLKNDLFDTTNNIKLNILIPKFTIKTKIDMEEILKNLNMKKMFGSEANLTKFLETPEALLLSKAIHQAVIEVNEEGAEASAATAHGFIKKSGPLVFRMNQSFMYFIKSTDGQIYFMGRYTGE